MWDLPSGRGKANLPLAREPDQEGSERVQVVASLFGHRGREGGCYEQVMEGPG